MTTAIFRRYIMNPEDILGQKFGKITVISFEGKEDGRHIYKCLCECGNEKNIKRSNLRSGNTKSCGCGKGKSYRDLSGNEYGRLTVLKRVENVGYSLRYLCICVCGNEVVVSASGLRGGSNRSCGCLAKERKKRMGLENKKHGLTRTRIYRIWPSMRYRCNNKNSYKYSIYGGRGIKVCDEWDNDFMVFHKWSVENGYSDELTIDRINPNGNYEPSNCRWASATEQNRNKRNNVLYTVGDLSLTAKEWSEITGLSSHTITSRANRGKEGAELIEGVNK